MAAALRPKSKKAPPRRRLVVHGKTPQKRKKKVVERIIRNHETKISIKQRRDDKWFIAGKLKKAARGERGVGVLNKEKTKAKWGIKFTPKSNRGERRPIFIENRRGRS